MLDSISIGTSKNPKSLISRINNEIKSLNAGGIELEYKINHIGDITFLGCNAYDKNVSSDEFKSLLANIIADIIIEDWAQLLVNKIIRDHYYYFSEEEKRTIKKKALELLQKDESKFYPLSRKNKIVTRVLEHLSRNHEIILEGFVNFRLKDYILELEDIVDAAADDFLEEKEYLEFIRLLRYFVDIQEPKVNEVHIILENDTVFKLVDRTGKEIENEYLDGFSMDLLNNNINYEDLLISALITLAPSQVVIHIIKTEPKDTLKTIENVFGKRVKYCSGCSLCT